MCAAEAATESYILRVAGNAGSVYLIRKPSRIASEVSSGCKDAVSVVIVVDSLKEISARCGQVAMVIDNVDFAEDLEAVCSWESRLGHYISAVGHNGFAVWSVEFTFAEAFVFAVSINAGSSVSARVAETLIHI